MRKRDDMEESITLIRTAYTQSKGPIKSYVILASQIQINKKKHKSILSVAMKRTIEHCLHFIVVVVVKIKSNIKSELMAHQSNSIW